MTGSAAPREPASAHAGSGTREGLDVSNGRRVVVTAGAGGIGLAIARAFALDGDRVHICDINEAALTGITTADPAITANVWTSR
ncbi:SDR family NAD(P)-dependent oxidoreductase [Cellulomonas fimi]|uniref:SDR family NAD(P)-dependent oxidoreductase n=1 Tax=Cellulomonas fimi TaxID=1708 RepID=A0A7Y0M1U1_CELFI|nr:SDR family NAD(P)-dependent oxidoreductase [Cellulomonas fimi]